MSATLAVITALLLIVGSLWAIPTALAWIVCAAARLEYARAQRDLYDERLRAWDWKS